MAVGEGITASKRDKIGKANRRLALKNSVPAVLYGPGREPMPLALDRHDFELFIGHHAAGATLVELNIEGESKSVPAMIKDIQHSPVKGGVMHIDFMEVSMNKAVHASVALNLINDPAGVKAGGVLTINVHEINVAAKPNDLPETIDVDVERLEVGDSMHLGDIVLPKGVELLDDPEMILASVQAPRVESEEPELETAEPELIGKGESEE